MAYPIDFSRICDFSRSWAIIDAPEIVNSARLSMLPYTNERALCAVAFGGRSSYGEKDNPDNVCRQGYLRASLVEFAGMEEALPTDLSNRGITSHTTKLGEDSSSLLRSIREIWNMRIHLLCREILEKTMEVIYSGQQRTYPKWLVDNWTEAGFKKLRNARYYDDPTIENLVKWFNNAQQIFGIQDLVIRAVEEYSANIITRYGI